MIQVACFMLISVACSVCCNCISGMEFCPVCLSVGLVVFAVLILAYSFLWSPDTCGLSSRSPHWSPNAVSGVKFVLMCICVTCISVTVFTRTWSSFSCLYPWRAFLSRNSQRREVSSRVYICDVHFCHASHSDVKFLLVFIFVTCISAALFAGTWSFFLYLCLCRAFLSRFSQWREVSSRVCVSKWISATLLTVTWSFFSCLYQWHVFLSRFSQRREVSSRVYIRDVDFCRSFLRDVKFILMFVSLSCISVTFLTVTWSFFSCLYPWRAFLLLFSQGCEVPVQLIYH
jgi:hypothetical protein